MSLIENIQKALAEKLDKIDNVKYSPDFDYISSHYASMSFPEVGSIDLFKIIEPPPKNSSQTTQDELRYLETITNNRSKQDIDLVYLVDDDPLHLFKDLIKQHDMLFPEKFFTAMYYTCVSAIIDHLKFFYNRARPFQIAEHYNIDINRIVTKTHKTPSYPSGHTMYAALAASILIDDYPEHKTKLESLVDKCGTARVLQGVHYPSDNEASKKIIKTIYPNIKSYFKQRRT